MKNMQSALEKMLYNSPPALKNKIPFTPYEAFFYID